MELPQKIRKSLEKLGVSTLYLFGSRAQGAARETSDYDFGVLLRKPDGPKNQDLYQNIYEVLQDVTPRRVNIDIVFLDEAPLQLCYHVIRYGQVLLDADPANRGRFEERILEEHADFEPYRRLFEEATLARI